MSGTQRGEQLLVGETVEFDLWSSSEWPEGDWDYDERTAEIEATDLRLELTLTDVCGTALSDSRTIRVVF